MYEFLCVHMKTTCSILPKLCSQLLCDTNKILPCRSMMHKKNFFKSPVQKAFIYMKMFLRIFFSTLCQIPKKKTCLVTCFLFGRSKLQMIYALQKVHEQDKQNESCNL